MTPNYETMSAGAELDAAVAEKVLGWTDVRFFEAEPACQGDSGDPAGWFGIPPGEKYRSRIQGYSSDLRQAWKVVERMQALIYGAIRFDLKGDERWTVMFYPDCACDTSFPLAVCRAALLRSAALKAVSP